MAGQSTNQFARMLDANKLKGAENFTDWEMDLRIVLDSEKLGYVLEGPLPLAVGEEASEEERRVFETWKDDDLRVKSYILSSLSPKLKQQYYGMIDSYSMMTRLRQSFENQEQVIVHKVAMNCSMRVWMRGKMLAHMFFK